MIMNKVLPMFKKKPQRPKYDKTNKKAVLKCSICTGEQVAGFKDIYTGHFDEIMLIRDTADLDTHIWSTECDMCKNHSGISLWNTQRYEQQE